MTKTTLAAIRKYGRTACVTAYWQHAAGEGAATIAITGPSSIRTTRQADAAINAGREIALAPQECRWFLRCSNAATTTVAHPVLGNVPCCARCAARAVQP